MHDESERKKFHYIKRLYTEEINYLLDLAVDLKAKKKGSNRKLPERKEYRPDL